MASVPAPFASSQSMAAATEGLARPLASVVSTPSIGPLFTITPGPTYASFMSASTSGGSPSGWITGTISSPKWRANSKSR